MELDPQVRVIAPPGGLLLFSGAQMHSSVPNTSGRTRLSIDFRTVHIDDVVSRRGAPNVDSECTGTCMHDYLRGTDLSHVPEELYALYQTQPPLVRASELQAATAI
jgi:ectoine hydroxylase-related dioxygenase (phytanoyl-CoA dioxygenase family)